MEDNLLYREGYIERIKPFIGKHIIKIPGSAGWVRAV